MGLAGEDKGDASTYQIIKLDCRHTTVYARDDLLGYGDRIDMVYIQAVTQPRDAGRDLVELDALHAPIWIEASVTFIRRC